MRINQYQLLPPANAGGSAPENRCHLLCQNHLRKRVDQASCESTSTNYFHLRKRVDQASCESTSTNYFHLRKRVDQASCESTSANYFHPLTQVVLTYSAKRFDYFDKQLSLEARSQT
jgi:hypothetical protein